MQMTILAKRTFVAAAVCACVTLFPAFAQEEGEAKPAGEAEETAPAAEEGLPQAKKEKFFYPLLRCRLVDGCSVSVQKPRTTEWVKAEEGRYYPLGSSIRVEAGEAGACRAEFAFGEKAVLVATNTVEFATKEIAIGEASRNVLLGNGMIRLDLPRTLPDGMFSVSAPFFSCSNLAGESVFDYRPSGDGDEAVVRCVTGSMALDGHHYKVERMGAANQVRIRSTSDNLFTSLRGESGDCPVILDQGLIRQKNFETGEETDVPKTLAFSLSPQCAIKIFRAKSEIGGRMVVSMMTFNPAGEMLNRCVFAENRANVNSGELVVNTAVPDADKEKAKAASEESEDVENVDGGPENKADGAEAGKGEEKKKDEDSDI